MECASLVECHCLMRVPLPNGMPPPDGVLTLLERPYPMECLSHIDPLPGGVPLPHGAPLPDGEQPHQSLPQPDGWPEQQGLKSDPSMLHHLHRSDTSCKRCCPQLQICSTISSKCKAHTSRRCTHLHPDEVSWPLLKSLLSPARPFMRLPILFPSYHSFSSFFISSFHSLSSPGTTPISPPGGAQLVCGQTTYHSETAKQVGNWHKN